ncbi:lipid III flippase WzxE [Tatumella sp. TA1]|uniref:lipid III flippase WzxE n=1 Tax=Rosenbergiella collisarenosi TaxID=1544695 RepID=UPI0008F86852|nr:lipid III flippase WzxE [Rosenbergiella collisarenosi]MBT0721938.1 lipid III flippase WzxE [Rosenbergiella collisarenosi]QGX92757.1 lipid III flippase WzxE [Tatumella sp. TA1]
MSFARASLWTASSTLIKILGGLVIVKLLAVTYGPEGIGLASNYRQLITVLSVMAGAGIFNGVTRYVAQYQDDSQQLRQLSATSSSLVLGTGLLIAFLLLVCAEPISQGLFGDRRFANVIRCLAFLQCGIGWANLLQAKLKGIKDARSNALTIIVGSLLAIPGYLACWAVGGYAGALIGLAVVPSIALLPALFFYHRRADNLLGPLLPGWDKAMAARLLKYTVMTGITAVTLPVAWVVMRHQLASHSDWQAVGLWQGVASVSDAYLQFITATFSVWLLPALSRLQEKRAIAAEIKRTLLRVIPVVMVLSFAVWLVRDLVIITLFSSKFMPMRDLFAWQLPGDVCKVAAYVFGYLVIARGSLRAYLLTELTQFILLLVTSHWLIAEHGVLGAVQAYCVTYGCYLFLVIAAFFYWYRK